MVKTKCILIILTLLYLIIGSACNKIPDGCGRFSDWKIISEEDKDEVCIYQQIYLYKDNYYTVCECCVCDKVSIVAIDCNDEPLCELTKDCMIDFFDKAEYLFSAN